MNTNEVRTLKAKIACICRRIHFVDPDSVVNCECGAILYIQADKSRIFPEITIDDRKYAHPEYLSNKPIFLGWEKKS